MKSDTYTANSVLQLFHQSPHRLSIGIERQFMQRGLQIAFQSEIKARIPPLRICYRPRSGNDCFIIRCFDIVGSSHVVCSAIRQFIGRKLAGSIPQIKYVRWRGVSYLSERNVSGEENILISISIKVCGNHRYVQSVGKPSISSPIIQRIGKVKRCFNKKLLQLSL